MYRSILSLLILTFILNSCDPIIGYKYPEGTLPETPVNLSAFNTVYDDYNSTAPISGRLIPFCFSSNRNSEGGDFDIIYEPMNVQWDKNSGELTILNDYSDWSSYQQEYQPLEDALLLMNSDSNELGPYFIIDKLSYDNDYDYLLMYSSDKGGDYQISFTYNNEFSDFNEPAEIDFLNSEYDDLYPSFDMDYKKIYFCSDRDNGVFNIYSATLERGTSQLVAEFTDDSPREIILQESVSGDYNDKCPFLYGDIMVFSSDRPGGEGGYDLYYSLYRDGEWTEPVNFGPEINSPEDDYRPILINEEVDWDKDMMIFSSDRPGGEGGFDLYFVGIEKMGIYYSHYR
ncbi:MAG: hypothetical protein ACQEQW_07260 [Bacteroidota bacterium]